MYPALDPLRAPGKVSGIPGTPAQPLHAILGALPARPPICISVCCLSVSGALPLSHFGERSPKSSPTKQGVSMPATNRTAANHNSGFSATGAGKQTGSSPLCLLLPRGAVRGKRGRRGLAPWTPGACLHAAGEEGPSKCHSRVTVTRKIRLSSSLPRCLGNAFARI